MILPGLVPEDCRQCGITQEEWEAWVFLEADAWEVALAINDIIAQRAVERRHAMVRGTMSHPDYLRPTWAKRSPIEQAWTNHLSDPEIVDVLRRPR